MFAQKYLSCCLLLAVINITPVYLIPQCPVHEFYNTGASKCTAEPTCQNSSPDPEHGCIEDNCQERCECTDGFIRDETKNGKCVPLSECPCTECGENEVFNTCASTCDIEPTCDNQTPNANVHCIPQTIQRCECAPGYVRGPHGNCIYTSSCPCVCGENEVFNTHASTCDIEPTCDNQTPHVNVHCRPKTIQRCECAPGYVRGPHGNCICTSSCPCVCGENEVFNTHASTCAIEPTCDNQTPFMNVHCKSKIIQRCECAPGYVRDAYGNCICTSSCPCVCGENEVLNTCASTCDIEPTCDNQTPEVSSCCVPETIQRCECVEGYVRDSRGQCICISSCHCPNQSHHHHHHHQRSFLDILL